ncbi:MAG TPA: 2-isopropylmalate synthase [Blastocatellia bacterium]|nr:2-isopropylmalate synthase [Blastocatellia bacterium]
MRIRRDSTHDRVKIFDTTLRDGEQSPGCSMNLSEKLTMAHQLEDLGVDIIEAGFAIASDDDFAAIAAISRECRQSVIASLARCTGLDIDRAARSVESAARPRIHTFIATSDIHLKHKLRKNRSQVLQEASESVRLARAFVDDVEFSAEDATRSDIDYLCQIVEAVIEAGATTVNLPDTVGYTTPWEYAELIEEIRARVKNIDRAVISVHCHNDLGLAVANSIAAVKAGARQVECTVNGIGERAGNASLEEFVMILKVRPDLLPYAIGVNTEQIYPSSQLLSAITGVQVQPNKAIVGRNAFAHEAGIHQDGVLKERLTYEIMTPQSVGIEQNTLVLGKHSGRHALGKRFEELGYQLMRSELDRAYKLFIRIADQRKRVEDEDLIEILGKAAPGVFEAPAVCATDQADGFASLVSPVTYKSVAAAGD